MAMSKKSQYLADKAKCKWFDKGEKSNKYFLNILKRRHSKVTLNKLINGDKTAHNQNEIEKLVVDFYSNLHDDDRTLKSDYDSFFPELLSLSKEDRRTLDGPITLEELQATLQGCAESVPGSDGIVYLVYKKCCEVFGPNILDAWNYSKSQGLLPEFNRTSTIILVPKEGKDCKLVGNWRPITLTNCDLKIFTKLLSNRTATVLPKIIINT